MRSEILLFCFTLWNFAGAAIPEDLIPLSVNYYRTHFLPFMGRGKDFDPRRIKMDIQQLLIVYRRLYVSARNNIYVIDLDKEHEKEIYYSVGVKWNPSARQEAKCLSLGKTEEECNNFIKVLVQKSETEILVCGTYAFEPICRYHKISNLNFEDEFTGRGRCPFDGKDPNIALFADGSLYSGTTSNFRGTQPIFQRTLGDLPPLKTADQDFNWFYDPRFIHAVDYGNYIYIFFHEVSLEFRTFGKVIVPRVARVCKNDMGGKRVLQKLWTSFLKARMICSVHSDTPFYFNVLRSVTNVVQIKGRDIVVAVFTTPTHSIPGSAVCAFDMSDIEKVFAGNFKSQKDHDTVWTSVHPEDVPKPRPGTCAGSKPFEKYKSSTDFPAKVLVFKKMHNLMDEAVPSTSTKPWFLMTMVRYQMTKIVIDTSAGPREDQIVAFLGTEQGRVLKVWDRSGDGPLLSVSILVEEMHVYKPDKCNDNGEEYLSIVSMELDKRSGALYVAFPNCVIKVPLGSCALYGRCKKYCIASRDPYCGWVKATGECKQLMILDVLDRRDYEQDLENGDVSGMDNC